MAVLCSVAGRYAFERVLNVSVDFDSIMKNVGAWQSVI